MKITVFGRTGQVATELARQANVTSLGREDADFTDPNQIAKIANDLDSDIFINAVAYTAVDKAEEDSATAELVNATSVAALAQAAAARMIPIVHISTDYVFDGTGTEPFATDANTGPLGVYGRTKLAGENALREAGGAYVNLRTSWVFSAHGNNFVKTMLRLGAERDALNIVADQIGGPTPAADIAAACLTIARRLHDGVGPYGDFHYSGAPDVSWADFAREIFAQSGVACAVNDIPTTDYPTLAQRPLNSRLDCSKTEEMFGLPRPDWRAGLSDILAELSEK
jgi:dTDP-4-dehydrorhamnose reductase